MQIICSKRFLFTHPKTQQHLIVAPSPLPQEVPDWITKERLFDLASGEGSIQVVTFVKTPAKAKSAKAPAIVGLTGAAEATVQIGVSSSQDWPKSPENEIGFGLKK